MLIKKQRKVNMSKASRNFKENGQCKDFDCILVPKKQRTLKVYRELCRKYWNIKRRVRKAGMDRDFHMLASLHSTAE